MSAIRIPLRVLSNLSIAKQMIVDINAGGVPAHAEHRRHLNLGVWIRFGG
ncbi:hypothetical protein ACPOL_6559 [Acidisarcina polymorpha]|uniref:Uncharacterized protein n=1 Tax=Acidisarcina polymorpha TaxID=2211140 RepID=A0A2Z5G9T2_9BACT|nr:hypothetical protein ACPOL_6559 [Acidisarcina polymorpha]